MGQNEKKMFEIRKVSLFLHVIVVPRPLDEGRDEEALVWAGQFCILIG
jgi:hypothetical protein